MILPLVVWYLSNLTFQPNKESASDPTIHTLKFLAFIDDRQQLRDKLGVADVNKKQFFILRHNDHWNVFEYNPPVNEGALLQISQHEIRGDDFCGLTSVIKIAQLNGNTTFDDLLEEVTDGNQMPNYEARTSASSASVNYLPQDYKPFTHFKKAKNADNKFFNDDIVLGYTKEKTHIRKFILRLISEYKKDLIQCIQLFQG